MLQHSPTKLYKNVLLEAVGGLGELPLGGEIDESA
jgi:hypothetical protein